MRDDIKINDRALALQDQIIEKLEKVFDTDVELDVYNLGLIYEINLDETGLCKIVMTFTDTACDCAESLPIEIVAGLKQIEGIEDVKVKLPGRLLGKSHESVATAVLPWDCHHDKSKSEQSRSN